MIHGRSRLKNRFSALLIAFTHLLASASAARPEEDRDELEVSQGNTSSDDKNVCPIALQRGKHLEDHDEAIARYHEFWLPYDFARGLNFYQQFEVKRSAECGGMALGEAWVVPVLDDVAPLNKSGASINIRPSLKLPYGSNVFVCSDREKTCIASLTLQHRPFHVLQYVEPLMTPHIFGRREWAKYLFLADWDVWLMEGLLVCLLVSFVVTIAWYIYTMVHLVKSYAARSRAVEEPNFDTNIKLLSTWNVVMKSGKDCAIFTLGCVILTNKADNFLSRHSDSNVAQSFAAAFPLLCGPWVILRFLRITLHSQIYNSCFKQGIMVDFPEARFEKIPFIFCFAYVFAMMLVALYAGVTDASQDFMDIALELFSFASPVANIFNAMNNMNLVESSVTDMECTLRCGGMSSEEPTPIGSSWKVKRVPADVLMRLARFGGRGRGASREIVQQGPEPELRFGSASALVPSKDLDLYNASKFIGETTSFMWRCLFLLWLPSLTIIGVCLGMYGSIDYLRDRVDCAQLKAFQNLASELYPPLQPELSKYTILTVNHMRSIGISADIDPDQTRYFDVKLPLNGNSTSPVYMNNDGFLAEALIKQPEYPVRVNMSIGQGESHRQYRMQLITSNIIPATLLLQGRTSSGAAYERCIPWNLLKYSSVYVPSMLSHVTLEVSTVEFAMDIPVAKPADDSFSTVFLPNLTSSQCKHRCHSEISNAQNLRRCRVQRPSKTGCYVLYEARWRNCRQTHEKYLASSQYQHDGKILGKICGGTGKDCQKFHPRAEADQTGGLRADLSSMFGENNERRLFMEFLLDHTKLKTTTMMDEDLLRIQLGGQHFPFQVAAFVDTSSLQVATYDGSPGVKRVRITNKLSTGAKMPAGYCNASMFVGKSLYLLSSAADIDWSIKWNSIKVRMKGSSHANDTANNSLGENTLDLVEMERWPGDCDSRNNNFLRPCHGYFPASVTRLSLGAVCADGVAQRISVIGVAMSRSNATSEHVKLKVDIAIPLN